MLLATCLEVDLSVLDRVRGGVIDPRVLYGRCVYYYYCSRQQSIITIEKMMEQLVDMPYTDFLDSTKGYFPVSSKHKLSRHFERIQAQLNLSEETVSTPRSIHWSSNCLKCIIGLYPSLMFCVLLKIAQ